MYFNSLFLYFPVNNHGAFKRFKSQLSFSSCTLFSIALLQNYLLMVLYFWSFFNENLFQNCLGIHKYIHYFVLISFFDNLAYFVFKLTNIVRFFIDTLNDNV